MQNISTKRFVLQQEESDCGVASLLSIIRFHGGDTTLEILRELSGTTINGTTLLGLHQAAIQIGMESEGFEGEIENLMELESPVILHVVLNNQLHHYVVLYGYENEKFVIGDPVKGISMFSKDDLNEIWKSKILLKLLPGNSFKRIEQDKGLKKEWFLSIIRDDFPILIIAIVLGVVITALSMSMALFSQKLIDEILPKEDLKKLIIGVSSLSILLLAKAFLTYLRSFFLNRQSQDFNNRIANKFYDTILLLPKSFFDSRKTGEFIARLNDTRRIQNTISYLIGNVVIDILVVILSFILIFKFSFYIGIFSLPFLLFYYLLVQKFNKPIINGQKDVLISYARTESQYIDTIDGIAAIKISNKEHFFSEATKLIQHLFQKTIFDLVQITMKYNIWGEVISIIYSIGLLSLSSFLVFNKHLQVGELIAIIFLGNGIISSIGRLATSNISIQEAKVAFDRMYEFKGIRPEYNYNDNNDYPAIVFKELKVKNLSFRFPGRSLLISDLSFSIKMGEILALVGEIGSGKSTILQLLQKFYKFEGGIIEINDENFENIGTKEWRDVISLVPQEVKIFNGTLIENIILDSPTKGYEKTILALQRYGLTNFFDKLPQGFNTILGGGGGVNLSSGQKQLVGIARAIHQSPQLLLLDEPTSAMDRNTEGFVNEIIKKLKEHMAILIVTHRSETAKLADNVLLLKDGVLLNQDNTPHLYK